VPYNFSNKVIISICVHYFDNEAFVTKSSYILSRNTLTKFPNILMAHPVYVTVNARILVKPRIYALNLGFTKHC
jgi:hypothetical protein